MIHSIKTKLKQNFPRTVAGYKRVKGAAYGGYFGLSPALATAIREFRQKAHQVHQSSFGMSLVGPRHLIEAGYEPKEVALVQEILQQVDVFVDVGANIGLYTCLAASKGCTVVAVEPLPSNLRCLYHNIKSNDLKGVEVFPIGLSSAPSLSVLGGMGAQASFLPNWGREEWVFSKHIQTLCPVSTLDIVLGNRFAGRRMLVKIDVEGLEFEVLKGATATLEMSPKPVWMLECFLDHYHPNGRNPNFERVFATFFDRGYKVRVASADGAVVTSETVAKWAKQGTIDGGRDNFFFEYFPDDQS